MKGGSAMLIATIISSAFGITTANVEASMLSNTGVVAENCHKNSTYKNLECRIHELGKVLLDFKQYYYDLCNGAQVIEEAEYQNLLDLESTLKGYSRLMKSFFTKTGEEVRLEHGEEGYLLLRKVVATYGQLYKVISNVAAFYAEQLGDVEIITDTHFTPSKEFWLAAVDASNKVYGRH